MKTLCCWMLIALAQVRSEVSGSPTSTSTPRPGGVKVISVPVDFMKMEGLWITQEAILFRENLDNIEPRSKIGRIINYMTDSIWVDKVCWHINITDSNTSMAKLQLNVIVNGTIQFMSKYGFPRGSIFNREDGHLGSDLGIPGQSGIVVLADPARYFVTVTFPSPPERPREVLGVFLHTRHPLSAQETQHIWESANNITDLGLGNREVLKLGDYCRNHIYDGHRWMGRSSL